MPLYTLSGTTNMATNERDWDYDIPLSLETVIATVKELLQDQHMTSVVITICKMD
jgi:hypothetical protein